MCTECGEKCEVPFKPTENKPVLCTRCFKKENYKEALVKDKNYQKEFDTLNARIDLILKEILELKEGLSKKKVVKKETVKKATTKNKTVKVKATKKATKKKPAEKKTTKKKKVVKKKAVKKKTTKKK
ncbi:hypothetical protein HN789_07375 [archaeon]|nr:hypothetical protein [archaeon]MBT4021800.1 hypothetical protein [archaeon]MBT4271785.1 hypothetical protein [archaeon]MBT4460520.1 hypothetical protein [archaeon]MBT4858540.1 hypothetical protein [archaeon]